MYDRVLNQLREAIRTAEYVMTVHAEEEMDDDGLTVFDVESIVLTGRIAERQRGRNPAEWKYLVKGQTLADDDAVVLARLSPVGLLVIITVYRE